MDDTLRKSVEYLKSWEAELNDIWSKLPLNKMLEKVILNQYHNCPTHNKNKAMIAKDVMALVLKNDFLDGECSSLFKQRIISSLLTAEKKKRVTKMNAWDPRVV